VEARVGDDRELFDPDVQARDEPTLAANASAGIEAAWHKIWELPVPYYRKKFEAAGLGPGAVPPLDEIERTTKADLRADEASHPPFGTHRAVSLGDAVRIGASGGTTGTPTLFFYGAGDLETHIDVGRRNMWRHGMRRGMRFTHSWPQGLYPSALGGGRQYLDLGVLEIPVGLPSSRDAAAEHLRLWEVLRPHAFMMTGSQLQLYEDVGDEIGIAFPKLLDGSIVAFLEASCQFEAPRRRFEDAYGVHLRNIGGTSDVPGFAVTDCRHHAGLHVAGDHFVIQVCDPKTGREVPRGERGSLVITAFGIDAVAIRYDVEDIVVQHDGPCPCGETGPRYTLLGRGADGVGVGGRMLLPLDVQLALEDLGAPEFQVPREQDGRALRLVVESDGGETPIAGGLRERLGVDVHVTAVARGSLPRAAFKPRRVGA
jgi:phenylacetate-CoA ligase